jgi:hypothetical protein
MEKRGRGKISLVRFRVGLSPGMVEKFRELGKPAGREFTVEMSYRLCAVMSVVQQDTKFRIRPVQADTGPYPFQEHVSLPKHKAASLEAYAAEAGLSVGEQVRQLLQLGYEISEKLEREGPLRKEDLERFMRRELVKHTRWDDLRDGFSLIWRALWPRR